MTGLEMGLGGAAIALLLAAAAIDAGEGAPLDRLLALMERDRVYREHDLGLSMLASRLTIAEYRLRRLVDRHLEHRNFTSFINGYRLAEAIWRSPIPPKSKCRS